MTNQGANVNNQVVRYRRYAPAILVTTAALAIFGLAFAAMTLTGQMLSHAEEGKFRLMRDVFESIRKSTEEKALVRAELVSSMPAVQKAFAERNREQLLAETRAMYAEQSEKYGLETAQFHEPPGISFLRLHKPEKYGDDQTSYRPMLVDVNRTQNVRKGIAIGRSGPTVAGIVPMQDEKGRHVGSFEMGLDLAPMLEKIKTAYGLESAIFLKEKLLRDIATDMPAEILTDKNRVGQFIRFHATHTELLQSLVRDKDVEVTEPKSYTRMLHGIPWGVQLVPLYNYLNKQVGVVALADEFNETRAAESRFRVWLLLGALFGVVLFAGITLAVVRGALLAPVRALAQRLRAARHGETAETIAADWYSAELRELAEEVDAFIGNSRDAS